MGKNDVQGDNSCSSKETCVLDSYKLSWYFFCDLVHFLQDQRVELNHKLYINMIQKIEEK